MTEQKPLEPWQWPEAHWRKLIDQVRAGRTYRPTSWPGAARCAFALSFDSDHETNELRDGGKSIGRMAWGQYGNRVGVPRILEMLKRHDVKASFYVPAVAALTHPDEQRRVIAEGHEIGIHGWIHELNSVLPYEAERDLMMRAADTLETITGVHAVLGLQPEHAADREGDGARLRFLAHGRRRLLRASPRGRADRDRRAAGRVDPRRRGLFHHASLPVAAALHAAERRARHLPARARRRLRRGRHLPAHHPPAHHRLPFAAVDPRRAHPARQGEGKGLVRDPRRGRRVGEGERVVPAWLTSPPRAAAGAGRRCARRNGRSDAAAAPRRSPAWRAASPRAAGLAPHSRPAGASARRRSQGRDPPWSAARRQGSGGHRRPADPSCRMPF